MKKNLTKLQAYNVIITFLDQYYRENKSDNLSDFITYAYFWFDKKTADPAAWPEWLEALEKMALQNKKIRNVNRLTYVQACNAMVIFFTDYCGLYVIIPLDIVKILHVLEELQLNKQRSIMWPAWIDAIEKIIAQEDPRFYVQSINISN